MKNLVILTICILSLKGFSQNSINDYQYLVLPLQYDFLKGKDQFRLNSLTRYLFKEEGYTVFFSEEKLPEDLFKDRCKAMYGDVKKVKGGFLKTNVQIEINDCYGNNIVKSDIGSTKEKQFEKAYAIALREAFESIKFLDYEYSPKAPKNSEIVMSDTTKSQVEETKEKKDEITKLKKEIEQLTLEKEQSKAESEAKEKSEVLKRTAEASKKEIEKLEHKEVEAKENPNVDAKNILYAQVIEGGFQLVDSEPKKVMVLLNTAAPNVFSVKGKDAIVFKENGQWIYSENTGTTKLTKVLNIKF